MHKFSVFPKNPLNHERACNIILSEPVRRFLFAFPSECGGGKYGALVGAEAFADLRRILFFRRHERSHDADAAIGISHIQL